MQGYLCQVQIALRQCTRKHATPLEVALFSSLTRTTLSQQFCHQRLPNGGFTDAKDYRGRFPDGRIGSNPGLATPEDGEVLAKLAAKEVAADFKRFASSE